MTRTSSTGSSTEGPWPVSLKHSLLETPLSFNRGGFTLLELMVVIALLGTLLVIVFPKITVFEGYSLKRDARGIAGLLRYIEDSASTRKIYYKVRFFPEEESLVVESSADGIEFKTIDDPAVSAFAFEDGTDMEDIVVDGLGKIYQGEVALVFNPLLGAEPFNLHLSNDDSTLTVSYNPYSGRIKISDGYI